MAPLLPNPYVPVMRGIGGAKTLVADYLRSTLPVTNATLRSIWQLPVNSDPAVNLLPDPDAVLDVEQGVLDAANLAQSDTTSCVVFISGLLTPKIEQVLDSQTADGIYDTTYQLSATTWLRGHRKDNVIRSRDNVAVAVRYCLLSDITVGSSGSAGWSALLDKNSITESYPYPDFDTTVARGDRHIMGTSCSFRIQVREGVGTGLIGYAELMEGEVSLLAVPEPTRYPVVNVPRHPADPSYM